jgi:hypothetical protein
VGVEIRGRGRFSHHKNADLQAIRERVGRLEELYDVKLQTVAPPTKGLLHAGNSMLLLSMFETVRVARVVCCAVLCCAVLCCAVLCCDQTWATSPWYFTLTGQ